MVSEAVLIEYGKAWREGNLFHLEAIKNEEAALVVVEKPEAALELLEDGFNPIAVNKPDNMPQLCNEIRGRRGLVPGVILALPLSDLWAEQYETFRRTVEKAGIPLQIIDCIEADNGEKELDAATEQRKQNRAEVQAAIDKLSGDFDKFSAAAGIDAFIEEVKYNREHPAPKTFSKGLNDILGGGLFPGLYVLGAEPGAGKTAFTMQLADHLAMNGTPVFVYSLEMSRFDLIARSVSRMTFQKTKTAAGGKACTAREIMNFWDGDKDKFEIALDALNEYQENMGNLYIIEGRTGFTAADIERNVKSWRMKKGTAPVVVVDYLQILGPMIERGTDKQNVDRTVEVLNGIARKYRTPVIAISSWNRGSYDSEGSLASYKESGSIDYTAGVALSLQFSKVVEALKDKKGKSSGEKAEAVREAKEALRLQEAPEVFLKVSKNRFSQSEQRIFFNFSMRYSCFTERDRSKEGFTRMTPEQEAQQRELFGNR